MSLSQVNNGDSGSVARGKINTAFAQVDTNTTDIAGLPSVYQAKDTDLTVIAGLTPSNNDTMQYIAGAWANRTVTQTKTTLGLNNVDNTSDANKPVSTATQTALNLKQDADAQSTVYHNMNLGVTTSVSVQATDYNTLIQFEIVAPATLTFPVGITAFAIGGYLEVANSETSTKNVTLAAGGGATLYVGSKGNTLVPGATAAFRRINVTEWLRMY